MKKLYSKSGHHIFNIVDVPNEDPIKSIKLYEIDNEFKVYCTLVKSNFPTRNRIIWNTPITEIKPWELHNILEVWDSFDFYFNTLIQ